MDKVGDRIAYMHLKNVDPAVRARVLAGELGIERSFAEGAMCPLHHRADVDGAVGQRAHHALGEGRRPRLPSRTRARTAGSTFFRCM